MDLGEFGRGSGQHHAAAAGQGTRLEHDRVADPGRRLAGLVEGVRDGVACRRQSGPRQQPPGAELVTAVADRVRGHVRQPQARRRLGRPLQQHLVPGQNAGRPAVRVQESGHGPGEGVDVRGVRDLVPDEVRQFPAGGRVVDRRHPAVRRRVLEGVLPVGAPTGTDDDHARRAGAVDRLAAEVETGQRAGDRALHVGGGAAAEAEARARVLVPRQVRQVAARGGKVLGVRPVRQARLRRRREDPARARGGRGNEQPAAVRPLVRARLRAAGVRGQRPAHLHVDGGGHEVHAVHLAPDERDLGPARSRAHLQDVQHRFRAVAGGEQFEVEHPRVGRHRQHRAPGELPDGLEQDRLVDLDRAERLAPGEAEAGVDVARGAPDPQVAVGGDPVDVQDLVRQVRLHHERDARGEGVRVQLRGPVEPGDVRTRRAAYGFEDHRPAVAPGEPRDGAVVRGGFRGGHRDTVRGEPPRHGQLVAEGAQPGRGLTGHPEFLAQLRRDVQVHFVQGDDPLGPAVLRDEPADGGADRGAVLGARHDGDRGRRRRAAPPWPAAWSRN